MDTTAVLALMGGIVSIIMTAITGVVAWYRVEERKEKDYIIGKYKEYISMLDEQFVRIKREFQSDGEKIAKMEREYILCQEDGARKDRRIIELEAQTAKPGRRSS